MAITKQQNPLSGFGEVTLIGDRNHVDPKGANRAKVFGSDIYSPRYPTVYYEVFKKDSDNLYKRFSDAAKELEYSTYDYEITDRIKEHGLEHGLLENPAVMYQFLKDNNIKVDIVYDKVAPSGYEDYTLVKAALSRHPRYR